MSDARNPSTKDQTEYLVLRRFPFAHAVFFPPSLNSRRPRLPGPAPEQLQALADYRAELAAVSAEELLARYRAEQQRQYEELVARNQQEERERYFNQPHAAADFLYWSKMPHWTLDEAVALSFGKAPERVRWEDVSKHVQVSHFAIQYQRRRELALRATQWKQLFDPVLPGIFLAWAERTDIPVPPELTEAVRKRGVQVADWKTLHDQAVEAGKRDLEAAEKRSSEWKGLLEESIEKLGKQRADWVEQLEKQRADWVEVVNARNSKIAALQAEIEALRSQPVSKSEPGIGTRERESLLKLVIGMAVAAYVYDPKATRSDKVREIADDLSEAGIPLDVDTVRKWLREAGELLPPKGE